MDRVDPPTEAQILEALQASLLPQEGNVGFTTAEFAEKAKCGEEKARKTIKRLMLSGVLVAVGQVRRHSVMDGRPTWAPGFRLK